MRISELAEARVALLGFGIEGRATLAALRRNGNTSEITALIDDLDSAPSELPEGVRVVTTNDFASYDVLIRSPGFTPRHRLRLAADARGLPQTTAMNLFLEELRAHDLLSVGVTGSKGKSTTSTLIFRGLTESGVPASLVGNIGAPVLDALDAVVSGRRVPVIEMSSYHCADLVAAPSIALLLQLFPEHMDWHGSVAAYYQAKLRLAFQQRSGDKFFCLDSNLDQFDAAQIPGDMHIIGTPASVHWEDGYFWNGSQRLFSDECVLIPGQHNKQNICAALAVSFAAGAHVVGCQTAVATFSGLPYRLQDEGVQLGIRWINDSISTAPEAAAAALRAFGSDVRTLIFGGFDRGYEFGSILAALEESSVEHVVVLPTTGQRFARELELKLPLLRVIEAPDLQRAVPAAHAATPSGSVCLFSPGAPSYGAFRDFAERGREFSSLVQQLARRS